MKEQRDMPGTSNQLLQLRVRAVADGARKLQHSAAVAIAPPPLHKEFKVMDRNSIFSLHSRAAEAVQLENGVHHLPAPMHHAECWIATSAS